MENKAKTVFVPMLIIPGETMDIEFYKNAFGAIELRRWSNDDGSIHVAELTIDGTMFHLHEENIEKGRFCPPTHNGVTTTIGLMVDDVQAVMDSAISAGANEISPVQDYEYGYRQAEIEDPFGHKWIIEKML
jgi:PhnB protein